MVRSQRDDAQRRIRRGLLHRECPAGILRRMSTGTMTQRAEATTAKGVDGEAPAVGVFGHYGDRNLGDEAIIDALIARIRREWPGARVVAFSMDTADSAERYRVPAFPIRQESGTQRFGEVLDRQWAAGATDRPVPEAAGVLDRVARLVPKGRVRSAAGKLTRGAAFVAREVAFLWRSYRRLHGLDALIIAGSNQFLDNFGGPWGFPYTLLKWSLLARLAGCRLLYVSVGAGPLDARLSQWMVRTAVRFADYLSFRDAGSQRLVAAAPRSGSSHVFPDLAHSLVRPAGAQRAGDRSKPTVGINPMPLYDSFYWYTTDTDRYASYVRTLAALAEYLVDRGYPVFFFPTQLKDLNVADEIVRAMRPECAGRLLQPEPVKRPHTVDELMRIIETADIVVGTRFHGTLLSLHARRPVLAICYYRKTRDLMREMGQEAYAIDFDDLTVSELVGRFHRLEERRLEAAAQIANVDDEYVDALENQYRAIFAMIRAPLRHRRVAAPA
ncbi:MAG: membrane protein [Rhodanobacteraceae bacterium]